MRQDFTEFAVSVLGILIGFIIAKQIAVLLAGRQVPISSGDPIRVEVPKQGVPTNG